MADLDLENIESNITAAGVYDFKLTGKRTGVTIVAASGDWDGATVVLEQVMTALPTYAGAYRNATYTDDFSDLIDHADNARVGRITVTGGGGSIDLSAEIIS